MYTVENPRPLAGWAIGVLYTWNSRQYASLLQFADNDVGPEIWLKLVIRAAIVCFVQAFLWVGSLYWIIVRPMLHIESSQKDNRLLLIILTTCGGLLLLHNARTLYLYARDQKKKRLMHSKNLEVGWFFWLDTIVPLRARSGEPLNVTMFVCSVMSIGIWQHFL